VNEGMSEGNVLWFIAVRFALLSLFAIGGANAAIPEMHRLAVDAQHWMTDRQFADMFAISQVSPGPNVIIVTLIGYHVAGLAGALVSPLISVDPQMGLGYLVPAFLAILIGGAGPLAGVLVGGGLVGGFDSLLTLRISPVAAQIAVLALAVVVIRLRPTGILGDRDDR